MSKKPYMRKEEMKYKSVQNKTYSKSFIYNDKKQRRGQIQKENKLKDMILQKMNIKEDLYLLNYENQTQKVRVNIHFSEKYKLSMILPSSFQIKQLIELVGCYVKLHLKHRPSQNHAYIGLIEMDLLKMKKQKEMKEQYEQKKQRLQENQQEYQQLIQQKQQVKEQQIQQNRIRISFNLIRFLIDNMLLTQKTNIQIDRRFDKINSTLKQIVDCHRYVDQLQRKECKKYCIQKYDIEEINLIVRYQFINSENNIMNIKDRSNVQCQFNEFSQRERQKSYQKGQQSVININQHLVTLNPNQDQLITSTPKQSLSKKKINKTQSTYQKLIKWFTQTQIVDWLLVYHLISNYTKKRSNKLNQYNSFINNNNRKQFIPINNIHQIKIYPVKMKQNQQYFLLVIIDWKYLSNQQINTRLNLINQYFIVKNHLPLSHTLREMYCFDNQSNENYQNNLFSHQNSNINTKNHIKHNINKFIIVFQLTNIKTIQLQNYFRSVITKLVHILTEKQVKTTNKYQFQSIQNNQNIDLFQLRNSNRVNDKQQQLINQLIVVNKKMMRVLDMIRKSEYMNVFDQKQSILCLLVVEISLIDDNINILVDSIELMSRLVNSCSYQYTKYCYGDGIDYYGRKRNRQMRVNNDDNRQNIQKLVYKQIELLITSSTSQQSTINYLLQIFSQSIFNNYYLPIQKYQININSRIGNSLKSIHRQIFINNLYEQTQLYLSEINKTNAHIHNHIGKISNNNYYIHQIFHYYKKQAQSQLTIFKQSIFKQNDYYHLNFYHSYQKPNILNLLENQPINIYQKSTTLKKKQQLKHSPNYNTQNNSPNHQQNYIVNEFNTNKINNKKTHKQNKNNQNIKPDRYKTYSKNKTNNTTLLKDLQKPNKTKSTLRK